MSAAEFNAHHTDPDSTPFRVDDDTKAAWAMRKLTEAQRELDRIRAAYRAEAVRLSEELADVSGPRSADVDLFTSMLTDYLRQRHDADPTVPQTYALPGGKVTRRKAKQTVQVTDPDLFVGWALDNDAAALKMVPQVSRLTVAFGYAAPKVGPGETAPLASTAGEIVPGVMVVRGDDTYGVTLTTAAEVEA